MGFDIPEAASAGDGEGHNHVLSSVLSSPTVSVPQISQQRIRLRTQRIMVVDEFWSPRSCIPPHELASCHLFFSCRKLVPLLLSIIHQPEGLISDQSDDIPDSAPLFAIAITVDIDRATKCLLLF